MVSRYGFKVVELISIDQKLFILIKSVTYYYTNK